MAEERSGLYVISIVAVVALVGLVTVFLRGGEGQSAPLVLDEEGNIVGEAFSSGMEFAPTRFSRPTSTRTAITAPSYAKELTEAQVVLPVWPCPYAHEFFGTDWIGGIVVSGSVAVSACQDTGNGVRVLIDNKWCTYTNECLLPGETRGGDRRYGARWMAAFSCSSDSRTATAFNNPATPRCSSTKK